MTTLQKPRPGRQEPLQDSVALDRIKRCDLSALASLYDRHAEPLMHFAVRIVGRAEAEDLLQATFVKAASIAASYDDRSRSARAWLFGIMAKLAQERRRSIVRFARAAKRFASGTRGHAPGDDDRLAIAYAVEKLSPSKRIVVILAEVEGYSCEDIATMLSIPVGTVWTRLHHGRRELLALYEGEDG